MSGVSSIENLGQNMYLDQSYSLPYLLIIAFIGGLILNVMPCILPVISLKILSLLKLKNHHWKRIKPNLIATSCGIVTSFVVLALLMISLKYAGQHVGLGFNFQQPAFVITLVLILMLFACSINQTITIDIPISWKHFLTKHSNESKLLGSFASGMFATVLATPCTAPFVGTAISLAFTLSFFEIVLVFAVMGLGMSMPFIALLIYPKALEFIPKPGPWLKKFKILLEALLYITILWLLWVLSNQLGLLPAIILFGICLLLKLILETKMTNRSSLIKIAGIAAMICSAYALPLKLFKIERHIEEVTDSQWHTFTHDDLEQYIDQGKVVLVDVTADWCVTCKYNKLVVLNNVFFLKFSAKHKVILMKAEYTNSNHEANRLLQDYARYGIPFTLVFSKKYPYGIVLPTVLKYDDVIKAIQKALPAGSGRAIKPQTT